ncbi:hypothetical protein CDES_09950 [Corynebacterium deserti GIMN1.010]|uniref:Uncharacterized protein n=1 Tax=Corynebacterium deserti GIMN1.010 TaxID=931089 RepID=A0A0M4CY98_9CORY|nr:hypothetical protein CDES_09950 [Corynebacterium deserti GIMN1.010]
MNVTVTKMGKFCAYSFFPEIPAGGIENEYCHCPAVDPFAGFITFVGWLE